MALAEKDRQAIRERLGAGLASPVVLEAFAPEEAEAVVAATEGPISRERAFRELIDDVAALSPQLTVIHHRWPQAMDRARELGVVRAPAVAIVAPALRGRMIQYGTPAGYEFRSFLAGIIAASRGGGDSIEETAREMIEALPASLHLQIFTSPGCPHCPTMATIAYELAASSARFSVDVIDVTEFSELARCYAVQGIPLTVVNDCFEMVGAMPAPLFLRKILRENLPAAKVAGP